MSWPMIGYSPLETFSTSPFEWKSIPRRRPLVTFQLTLNELFYTLGVGFVIGVAFSTLLYLHLTSGIRITHYRTHERRCPDK